MTTTKHSWAWMAFVLVPFLSFGAFRFQKKVIPEHADIWNTTATITTSPDAKWVYITLAPKTANQPIQDAFTAQYDSPPIRTPIRFQGEAQVVATRGSNSPAPYSLLIKPQGQTGWMFKVDSYGGTVPKDVVIENPIGIAHYNWGAGDQAAPKSHQEFVDARNAALGVPTRRSALRLRQQILPTAVLPAGALLCMLQRARLRLLS